MVAAGRVVRLIGLRAMFACAGLISAIAFGAWAVLTSPEVIIATRVLSGIGYAGIFITSVMAMQLLLPPRLQGSGQALASMTTAGVAAFIANVLGGVIYGGPGHRLLFAVAAAFALVGAALGWLWLPGRGAGPDADPARTAPMAADPDGRALDAG